jgi:hypothetical protein
MKGDFTRVTFERAKHYSSVRQQQGRVQLDSDWNEELDLLNHIERTARIDIIGHCGGPIHDAGFGLGAAGSDLTISAGRYYVEGILCEKEAEELLTAQADLPGFTLPAEAGRYLAYLDVWERHITALEDPDIREVALGGPDTATRTQVVAQVKLLGIGDENCDDFDHNWVPPDAVSNGRLAARSQPGEPPPEPCIVPARAGYRRLENQLYRVEIHTAGGLGAATFKWSRENGSVVFRVVGQDGADKLLLSSPPLDANLGLATGNWVELTDDGRDLRGEPGVLMQVLLVEDTLVTIDPTTIADPLGVLAGAIDLATFGPNTRLRRWESAGALTVEVPGTNDGFIELEDGVEIAFGAASTAYQTGDYWQIPARTNTGDVIWPEDPNVAGQPEFQTRHGILHYYCPLAIIAFDGETWGQPDDCRHLFPPLTELPRGGEGCCTFTVGDGTSSVGDFSDIQEAVNALPQTGGRVCLLPGVYPLRMTVTVHGVDIIISGCGRQARIIGPAGAPAFEVAGQRMTLESLFIEGRSPGGVVVVDDSRVVRVADCQIANVGGAELANKAGGPVLVVTASRGVTVINNLFAGLPTISLQAVDAEITDNRLTGGGLWVRDGSAAVRIQDNEIGNGQGPGIALGVPEAGGDTWERVTGVENVDILGNRILRMGNSGITTVAAEARKDTGDIDGVTITGNTITGCGRSGAASQFEPQAVGGITLRDAGGITIHGNTISDNGSGQGDPACGIFTYLCRGVEVTDDQILNNGAGGQATRQCIDFRTMAPQQGPNPRTEQGVRFTVFSFNGAPAAQSRIQIIAGFTGLDSGFSTEAALPAATSSVSVTLVHFSSPARIEGFNAQGASLGTASMSGPQRQAETLTLNAAGITRVVITAPQNEALLQEFCFIGQGGAAGGNTFQGGIVALFALAGGATVLKQAAAAEGGPALRIHDNVVDSPRGQALIAHGLGSMSIADNTLASHGLAAQPLPLVNIGRAVIIFNLGRAPLLSDALTRSPINTGLHAEAAMPAPAASFSLAASAAAQRSVPDGRVLFHGNQVTLEVDDDGLVSGASVVAFSLDDVALLDNQIQTETPGGMLIAVAAWAASLRAAGNRFTEIPLRAFFSYLSFGLVNQATSNQATHCIAVGGGNPAIDAGNQVLVTLLCERLGQLLGSLGMKG